MRILLFIISILLINITICPKGGYLMDLLQVDSYCVIDMECSSDVDGDCAVDKSSTDHEHPCADGCTCVKCISIAFTFNSIIVQGILESNFPQKSLSFYYNSYYYLKGKKHFQPPSIQV